MQLNPARPGPSRYAEVFSPVAKEDVLQQWTVTGRFKWARKEAIPVLEARASLYAVKHVLRRADNFHKRHLVLSDSIILQCVVLIGDEGGGSR